MHIKATVTFYSPCLHAHDRSQRKITKLMANLQSSRAPKPHTWQKWSFWTKLVMTPSLSIELWTTMALCSIVKRNRVSRRILLFICIKLWYSYRSWIRFYMNRRGNFHNIYISCIFYLLSSVICFNSFFLCRYVTLINYRKIFLNGYINHYLYSSSQTKFF